MLFRWESIVKLQIMMQESIKIRKFANYFGDNPYICTVILEIDDEHWVWKCSHLQIAALRGKAMLAVDTHSKQFKAYAHCSEATMCHNCTHQERNNFVWPHSLQPRCLSRDFATKPKRSGNCVAPYKLFLSHFIVCRECHSLASVPADSSPSESFLTRHRMLWQGSLGHSFSLP